MFKPYRAECVNCKQITIVVVKAMLCAKCNYDQKQAKKKAAGKPTGGYKYKREPTGEKQLFEKIADERPWKCFVTGQKLPYLTPTSFLHVLPKAQNRFPLFKLYKKNIVLGSDEVHDRWDKAPRESLTEPFWQKMFDLEAELKEEYAEMLKANKITTLK